MRGKFVGFSKYIFVCWGFEVTLSYFFGKGGYWFVLISFVDVAIECCGCLEQVLLETLNKFDEPLYEMFLE